MRRLDLPTTASRRIRDSVVIIGTLTAVVMAIFLMNAFFAVVKRSSKQEEGGMILSDMTPVRRSTPAGGGRLS